jgi:hypothetical protein
MAVTSRSILSDIVTAYEITPGRDANALKPAELDEKTVGQLFERLMEESRNLTEAIKSEKAAQVKPNQAG